MFATVLIAAFALASVATVLVLADSGLRWWSAFGTLRQRMKQGYASAGVGPRPSIITGSANGFGRQVRAYPVIRQVTQRAA
ncbi:hypothetical protein K3148_10545 [Qipengyuania aurantiaca]|uniref:Uncharacterized protein n=1 Tax=Qipengyuania aurantiaca TaxID=2867233 RepID=A0ABX8ZJR5_9SPHN|nr:hypothetical protein [Qipengyuania aurantiaca]QZD89258.1 hypothetical protein K3148_10545 [Qipengyuania aurantiaca]